MRKALRAVKTPPITVTARIVNFIPNALATGATMNEKNSVESILLGPC